MSTSLTLEMRGVCQTAGKRKRTFPLCSSWKGNVKLPVSILKMREGVPFSSLFFFPPCPGGTSFLDMRWKTRVEEDGDKKIEETYLFS